MQTFTLQEQFAVLTEVVDPALFFGLLTASVMLALLFVILLVRKRQQQTRTRVRA